MSMTSYYRTEQQAILYIRKLLKAMKGKEADFKTDALSMQVFEVYPCSRRLIRSTIDKEATALGAKHYEETDEWLWPNPALSEGMNVEAPPHDQADIRTAPNP